MKIKHFLYIATLCMLLCACRQQPIISEKECDSIIISAVNNINDYYFTNNRACLDSALLYLNQADGRCEKYKYDIAIHKTHALFLRQEYQKAINTLKKIDDNALPFVEYKDVIKYKIKAGQALHEGKSQKQQECYKEIVTAYEKYFKREKSQLDSVLCLSDIKSITSTAWEIFLSENYYYKSKIKHKNDVLLELDSMQKAINGNAVYFDRLKEIVTGDIKPNISLEI